MAFGVVHSAQEWVARFGNPRKRSVVTIGNFDGVHLGHQRILRTVLDQARRSDALAAVLTFYPHPARVLRPAEAPALLQTLEQRLAAIDATGIDAALVLRFDAELANVSPEDFVRRFLVDSMAVQAVLVGGNFRFGHRGSRRCDVAWRTGPAMGIRRSKSCRR